MTDQETVAAFIATNDRSPVVKGWAREPDPRKPGKGGTYKLKNGKEFALTLLQCRLLPKGYPKWMFS